MKTSLFAALLLALSLTACNSEKSASTEAAPAAAPVAAEAAPATPGAPLSAEDAEKEKIRKQNAAAEAALSGH
ncbi:hypothetical protein [Herminiimonas fonticola]|uniref:Lipoprotein n=1 Tax=Herminiimonas fonticola TaxID=303380 RepID=A0A4R6G5V3_9BURK|nr:hypothetical protein [Herminiimonas fonticola]RBA23820.1 hypothetical protein Hfont_1632 [Herminiimonas fonticola]TDN89822.1 hypothetical protein EV677_1884 [Herminiimonas fonticola]